MNRNLILASGSPRRKDLLEFFGHPFEVVVSDFPEENVLFEDFEDGGEYVLTIASGKVMTVAPQFEDAIIIGADTTVYMDGQVFNKPTDLDDARRILSTLRGKSHEVVTGVVVWDSLTGEHMSQSVATTVSFFPFSDEELDRYIDTGESLGKAGAYAIQMGAKGFVRSVDGSLSNVVGLPIEETAAMLEQMGMPIDVNVRQIVEDHFTHR